MSPAIALALLSMNLVGLFCSVYFAKEAGTIEVEIRSGVIKGIPISKRDRLLMLTGNWLAPVTAQLGLNVMLLFFNLEIAAHVVSVGARSLAYLSALFWILAGLGTVGFGTIHLIAMRARVRSDAD
jgi:uncharacterized membrane protein